MCHPEAHAVEFVGECSNTTSDAKERWIGSGRRFESSHDSQFAPRLWELLKQFARLPSHD
eukprot:3572732-Pyramimonas_sp.AAC.1